MSDIFLVAVVGIVGAALSGILAAAIAGFITYKTTERQVKARLEELQWQLQHDREEARKGRLVEARQTYLFPLRSGINDIYGACSTVTHNTVIVQQLRKSGLAPPPQIMDQVDEAVKTLMSCQTTVVPLLVHIADPSLQKLASSWAGSIGGVVTKIVLMSLAIHKTLGTKVEDLESFLKEMLLVMQKNYEMEPEDVESLISETIESLSKLTPQILSVNQRIEELLSGD